MPFINIGFFAVEGIIRDTFVMEMFAYMFVMSNRHSFMLFMQIVLRLWMRIVKFWMLKALGSCDISFNSDTVYVSNLHPGLCFQLTIGRIDLRFLCNFIMLYIYGTLGVTLLLPHMRSLRD